MNQELLERFCELRKKLFDGIKLALEVDGYCKSYEGTFSIIFPNYFQERLESQWIDDSWCIGLDCYVLGPGRHYTWCGETFEEALEKAEKDILEWVKEEELYAEENKDW